MEVATPIVADGMVLYCDGSSRPNPGFIGAGIHGYAYNKEVPKKGTGLPTHSLTKEGYIDNKDIPKEQNKVVTPLMYYNCAGSFDFQSTNNVAELLATHVAIRLALLCNVKKLHIKTDSEYVIKVLTKFAAIWVKSNWLKRDGTPVSNQDFIKDILVSVAEMQEKNIKFDLEWVKGHSTHIGNIAADKLANIGSEFSRQKKIGINVQEHPPEGYWKQETTRHPFLCHPRAYFTSDNTDIIEGMYFIGNHGKDDDFVGRPEVDNAMAVIFIKNKEEVLDIIINHCKTIAGSQSRFFFARLDSIYTKNRDKDIVEYKEGTLIVEDTSKRLDIISADEVELVRDLQPLRLSERAFTCLSDLMERLNRHMQDNDFPRTVVTDITSNFYENTRKIVKNVETISFQLHKKYIVGYRSEKITIKNEKGEIPVIFTLGIDLPDRNALKRLESLSPKIKVLSWMESDHCMRYATVITTGAGDYSIWSGFYSNQIYLD